MSQQLRPPAQQADVAKRRVVAADALPQGLEERSVSRLPARASATL